jgi:hypothetical protein
MNAVDQFPLWLVLIIATGSLIIFIEAGFRYGTSRNTGSEKAQMAQVRAIMGASLGMLAFMLAFSFSMAQQHFEERTQAYLLEVGAIDQAFRGADLIQDEARLEAQALLVNFAQLRIETAAAIHVRDTDTAIRLIRESERIHDQLWSIVTSIMDDTGTGGRVGMFAQSVLTMIDAHDARLQASLYNRISPIIWITLFLMSLLSMLVMGYQAGLTGARSHLATWTLALTFSAVMTLITDLDRPNMSLFQVNQELMVELESRMAKNTSWLKPETGVDQE